MVQTAGHEEYDSHVGARAVSGSGVAVLTALFVGYSAVLVYAAMAFWPPALASNSDPTVLPPATTTTFFGQSITIAREQNLLLLVAILGSLGAMAYVLRSFSMYVGQRRLRWSWVAQYVATPFLGAVLATITYILLRAGLVGGSGSEEGNIWGFAAVATLVGLFNLQAASKLKDIFEVILAPSDDNRGTRDRLDAVTTSDTNADASSQLQVIATNGSGNGSGSTGSSNGDGVAVELTPAVASVGTIPESAPANGSEGDTATTAEGDAA